MNGDCRLSFPFCSRTRYAEPAQIAGYLVSGGDTQLYGVLRKLAWSAAPLKAARTL